MVKLSAFIATLLSSLLLWKLSLWSVIPTSERSWTGLASIYGLVLMIAGWSYAISKGRTAGWIHALLMLGVAGACGYLGFHVFWHQAIAGGQGPDANPVGGILSGIGLLYSIVAIATAACGGWVIMDVVKNERGKN